MMIVFIVMLIIWVVLVLTNRTAAIPNGNILLAVTLPHSQLNNDAVTRIVSEYRRACIVIATAFMVLMLPMLWLSEYVSLTIIYITFWCTLLFYMSFQIHKQYCGRMYALKLANGWLSGERHIIHIDTAVSRLKGKMPLSKLHFLPTLIISLVPIVLRLYSPTHSVLAFMPLFIVAISFACHNMVSRERTIAYSKDSDVNLALNRTYKYQWSRCWVILAYAGCIPFTLLYLLICNDALNIEILLPLLMCYTFLCIIPILSAHNRIRSERQRLLSFDSSTAYTDDDEYWLGGIYNNPHDKRLFVEKRIGYGTTTNMATRMGKATWLIIAAVVLIMLGLAVYLSPLDFGSIELSSTDNTATISAPMYNDSISLDEIVDIELIDTLPPLSKQRGSDSPRFYVGRFKVDGYGSCSLYVRRYDSPYIVITLPERTIFLNGNTPEQTEQFYLLLSQ